MMLFFLLFIIKFLMVLLAIAFVTLFERKALGFSQQRLGPNKVILMGIFQPVLDGIKLFLKEIYFPKKMIFWGIVCGPSIGFLVMIFLWLFFNSEKKTYIMSVSILFLIIFIGLSVYSTLLSGWSSTSKYSTIGGIRSCSQSVSYEICLVFFLLSFLLIMNSMKNYFFSTAIYLLLFPLMFLSCVAETNRAPFDFSEGESELISGFNVEFGSGGFVLLFLAEYGMILFFSFMISLFFFEFNFFMFSSVVFLFIFIQSVYPRFRYDMLMKMMWMKFLPLSLFFVLWFLSIL